MEKKKQPFSKQVRKHKRILYDLFVTIENIIIDDSSIKRSSKDRCAVYIITSRSNQSTVLLTYEETNSVKTSFNISTDLSCQHSMIKMNETAKSPTKETDSKFPVLSEKYEKSNLVKESSPQTEIVEPNKKTTNINKRNIKVNISNPKIIKQYSVTSVSKLGINHTRIIYDLFTTIENIIIGHSKVTRDVIDGITALTIRSVRHHPVVCILYELPLESESKSSILQQIVEKEKHINKNIPFSKSRTYFMESHVANMNVTALGALTQEKETGLLNFISVKNATNELHKNNPYVKTSSQDLEHEKAKRDITNTKIKTEPSTFEREKNLINVKIGNSQDITEKQTPGYHNLKLKEKHLKRNLTENDFYNSCSQAFRDMPKTVIHDRIHSKEKTHKCIYCEKTFAFLSSKKRHEKLHTGEKPFKWEDCEKTFNNISNKIRHKKIHTGEKPYKCEHCGKTFAHLFHKKNHERVHTGEKPYKCEYCEKSYNQLVNKINHERYHTGERPFKCDYCEKSFADISNKIRHARLHTEERPYKCEYCEKAFAHLSHKIRHERVHTGEKPFKCEYCEKSFSDLTNKRNHERVHTGEKPYKCKHCQKTFAYSTHKRRHERQHSGDKPYKCEYCELSFIQLSVKKRHEKLHTGEKSYKCEYCEKQFAELFYKNAHERQRHFGEKPYKCEYCEKTFSRSSYKKVHERQHTGEKP